ncbi:MAG: hypothetical protein GEV13_00945 [Rhodospirillales bacterium]|nr:hypothetical protein [Rhodospirillales bacterium]
MKVWTIAALCLVPGAAWGQTAAFKCAKPGTVVQYQDGSWTEWVNQEANYCRVNHKRRNEADPRLSDWYAPMASVSINSTIDRPWLDQVKPQAIWPLSVGKKLSGRYDGANNTGTSHGSWTFTFTVEKYERITTKAGTFDTFAITRTQEGIGRPFKEKWTQWYAPEPGVVVRYDYWNNQGRTNKGDAVAIKGR